MASMGGHYLDAGPLIRKVKGTGMVNKLLQNICTGEGLNRNGVKAELQQRIVDKVLEYSQTNDATQFHRLKQMIDDPHNIDLLASPYRAMAGSSSSTSTPLTPGSYLGTPNSQPAGFNMGAAPSYRVVGHPRVEFKQSPYYVIEEQLGGPTQCDVMTHHRHTVKITLKPGDYPILDRVQHDPALKVMVFCAAEGHGKQDIAFPHQSEIKVNGGEIKANLRGLKNKPGSTRPVDITKELRLKNVGYFNNVEMTYALTTKKYYLILFVVRSIPVEDLVKRLETGKRITQKTVIDDMLSKARDADIVTTASVLSLKCPLSTLRISLPCRSTSCRHIQCFDATSYLQLQEQGPTWLCPICNNPALFDSLAVDEYVKDILKNTSKSVDQVTIQPNGKWELNTRKENMAGSRQLNGVGSDSDDDIVEITESGNNMRMTPVEKYKSTLGGFRPPASATPQSRESTGPPSGQPRSSSTTSGKRPRPAIIDLTSSGDEEEEPLSRAPKRQQFTNGNVNITLPAHPSHNGYPRLH